MTCSCLNCFLTSAGNLLTSTLFISIKNFYNFFCTFIDVENEFSTIKPLNQAIQPRVVGPLLYKRYIGSVVTMYVGFESGTSMCVVRAPWRVSAMARKVGLV